MKYPVEISLGAMAYMKTGSGIQNLKKWGKDLQTYKEKEGLITCLVQ
jgi:hypothetical protein